MKLRIKSLNKNIVLCGVSREPKQCQTWNKTSLILLHDHLSKIALLLDQHAKPIFTGSWHQHLSCLFPHLWLCAVCSYWCGSGYTLFKGWLINNRWFTTDSRLRRDDLIQGCTSNFWRPASRDVVSQSQLGGVILK